MNDRSSNTAKVQQDDDHFDTKPKRPLSTYNFFFQDERKKLLLTLPIRQEGKPRFSHGKCGFASMAKIIAKKWNKKEVDPQDLIRFQRLAKEEKIRYRREMEAYNKTRKEAKKKEDIIVLDGTRTHNTPDPPTNAPICCSLNTTSQGSTTYNTFLSNSDSNQCHQLQASEYPAFQWSFSCADRRIGIPDDEHSSSLAAAACSEIVPLPFDEGNDAVPPASICGTGGQRALQDQRTGNNSSRHNYTDNTQQRLSTACAVLVCPMMDQLAMALGNEGVEFFTGLFRNT
ncbi:hypothetical protein ACA910_018553 [Epithemia clementina (nom. ined.)]